VTTFATDLYLLVAAYGLAVAVSYAGLPVLGQGAFVAIGAFGTAQFASHSVPLGVAVIAAVSIAAVTGYLVGFAAARLAGASLALATWALAWLAYTALVVFPSLGGGAQGITRPTPARLVSPALGVTVSLEPWVHVVIASVLAVLIGVALARSARTAWGVDLAALRTGPVLAESLGVPVQRRRRSLMAVAAALGAVGGAGTAVLLGVVAPVDYSPLLSLQLFVAVLVGTSASWWGPPVGVALLAALPDTADGVARLINVDALRARAVLTALLLVVVLVVRRPLHRLLAMRRPRSAPRLPEPRVEQHPTTQSLLLELRNVRSSYGAVSVLDGLDLDLHAGEVHALVGPNGSGKSTALRIAAGVVRPDAGEVRILGQQAASRRGAAARVRAGVARTLQQTMALGNLDAATQTAVGARARERLSHVGLRELLATPQGRGIADRRAATVAAALSSVDLDTRADVATSHLNSGEQRLLQIARCVATGAPALLLDEPAAGMSPAQRRHLVGVLRSLADRGLGVLIVEHDMGLVGRVADRVTVLSEGRVLASGAPADVRRDPAVARAYLGMDPVTG